MNRNKKQLISLLLFAALLLSLTACGGSKKDTIGDKYTIANSAEDTLTRPETKLDADAVLAGLTYTPAMFYGDYAVEGAFGYTSEKPFEKALETFANGMKYWDPANVGDDMHCDISIMPYAFEAGPEILNHKITRYTEHNWIRLYFYGESGDITFVLGAYTIEGNTLTFWPIDDYKYNDQNDSIYYTLAPVGVEYQFAFDGRNVTFSRDGLSITYITSDLSTIYDNLYTDCVCALDSPMIDDIEGFNLHSGESSEYAYIYLTDDTTVRNCVFEITEDGLMTFSWKNEEFGEVRSYQYYVFFGGDQGLVLTDGDTTYYYTDTRYTRYSSQLGDNIADAAALESVEEARILEIIEKRDDLLNDLTAAFAEAGLDARVDAETGEIALDATVLFGFDEATLTAEGTEFLNRFLQVFSSVILDAKYEGFVSDILVEGHTDTQGNYDYNLTLSQERADTVKDYCLSGDAGLDAAVTDSLSELLTAYGYSYDQPIYNDDGTVNADASRRVSFRFLVNLS